ncbi:50S ribosomal protein L25 [Rubrobacter tropicus]|uniref:Large ribosomal subunit protein bL25 n=1 Tax=Rubrobacter tropicus TaxID=2653851 RepID=A0A6G8Q7F5_9ACTN|nr:50S ribosomal protein L25 [Rubrobacter tropicus]QIN82390.1 50S ribosomal protein L25 [Rubrobacter tropicus]
MADNVTLQARERDERGKNAARRLRASGMLPAILYGDGESTSLAVETRTLDYTLTHFGDNALYDIDLGSGNATARVVDAHRDPVTGLLVHVDFAPVNMREKIEVTVPLTVVGEAAGSEEGGVLQQVAYEIQVETLPGDIPQEITLDVTPLGMNENLTLGDLSLPEGVELLSDPEEVAATVTQPTEITDEEMEAAGIVEEESDEELAEGEEAEGEEAEEGDEGSAEEGEERENG